MKEASKGVKESNNSMRTAQESFFALGVRIMYHCS